ncbi:MAG: YdcF family protein [Chloroflexi bacterium]|nr:YdcF family protein [Chloroflexota bacterium]
MTDLPHHKTRGRKILKRIILFCLLAAILYFAAFTTAIHIAGTRDNTRPADVIIVLGAGLRRDGGPGWALTRRSSQAADLWRLGIAPSVICTGGQAESFPRSEADACREILRNQGLPQSAILLEDKSRSTEENALFSSQLMAERGWTSAVLVSDSYHMLRAGWLFTQHDVETYASPVPANRIHHPHSYPHSLLREFLAFHWQVLKEALNLPVTYLSGL